MRVHNKYMPMRRVAALLLAICVILASCVCVGAQTQLTAEVVIQMSAITIKGKANPNEVVSISVARNGNFIKSDIVFVDDCTVNENGVYSFSVFLMPDAENSDIDCSGDYVAVLNGSVSDKVELRFTYNGRQKREKLITDLNKCKTETDVKTFLTKAESLAILEEFGFVTDGIVNDNSALFTAVNNGIPFSADEKIFYSTLSEIFMIQTLETLKGEEVESFLKTNADKGLNLVFDDENILLDADELKFVAEYIENQKIKSIEDLNSEIQKGSLLYHLSNESKINLTKYVTKYAEIIGLSTENISDYTSTESFSRSVNEKILIANNGKGFDNLEDFKDAFKTAMKKVSEEKKSTGGGKTNGGGGSGGYSGNTAYVGNVTDNSDADRLEKTEIESVFNDMAGYEWAQDCIMYLYRNNIVSGDGRGNFNPADNITREEFLKILFGALQMRPSNHSHNFSDVEKGAWYEIYVSEANAVGITKGISDSLFGIGSPITREDAAVMIMRGCAAADIAISNDANSIEFSDKAEISDYAESSVSALASKGIIKGMGDGSFAPKSNLTRAEGAMLIYGVIQWYRTEGVNL